MVERVDSSNLELLRRISTGQSRIGDVLWAREQTAGRGRRGRSFHSIPDKSLTLSVLLGPDQRPIATAMGALAVHDALIGLGLESQIKWPNDVLLGGRKVAGVLAEGRTGVDACVLGIGVNIGHDREDFDAEFRLEPTSLRLQGLATTVDAVGRRLLGALRLRLEPVRGSRELVADLFRATALAHREVVLETADGRRARGRWRGLDERFQLHLEGADGHQVFEGAHVEHLRATEEPASEPPLR